MYTLPNLTKPAPDTQQHTAWSQADLCDALEIRRALLHGQFRAYLQPQFDLSSGAVDALEVLARWQHPELGLLTPATFIPALAHKHLLDDLLHALLDQGLACQIELYRDGHKSPVAFNLSLPQLANASSVERLIARLREHPLPLSWITLEITEDGPAVLSDFCVQNAMRLRQLGVRLSLDDYGTGQSSLLRLCQLPFDEIKLAGELIRQLLKSPRQCSIVRTTVNLAKELGLRLVVEGIETEDQRRCLAQLGVGVGQGYLRAQPMSVDALRRWLALRGNDFAA
ncbi:EAL domain-containing protein [Pseudomonas putida]|uniref:EAL domain-containing protein n=1 Tax=Pseudomonas putida TaxID=303 RepID=UPI0018D9A9C7|nr:EAL domain-containing protein [Pseudomonas putida]MBH3459973.1 EAL domain-containing protein [Pseudomonas putida]